MTGQNMKIDENKNMVGKVYANWCGHCKDLIPEWNKLSGELKSLGAKDIAIVSVESEDKKNLDKLQKLGIVASGFPTIFKRVDGKVEMYNGKRLAKDIASWAVMPVKMPVMRKNVLGGTKTKKRKTFRKKRALRNTIRRWFF